MIKSTEEETIALRSSVRASSASSVFFSLIPVSLNRLCSFNSSTSIRYDVKRLEVMSVMFIDDNYTVDDGR